MKAMPIGDEEIAALIRDYPKESAEHAVAVELLRRDEDWVGDDDRSTLTKQIDELKTELKELAKHIRTTDGLDALHRLRIKGLL